jgi:glutathione S-transferase
MLRLYFTPNTCALASHIALEMAGAPYEAIKVDFAKGEQKKPEYLAVNPKGRVPALVTERGVLTETPAILVYIAQRFPAATLAPLDDAFALAEAQAFNSYLCSTVHVAHAHRMRGTRWSEDPGTIEGMKRGAPKAVAEAFALIEKGMLKGPWVLGDVFSISDLYLFTLAQWLEADGVDTASLPRVMDHRRRVAEIPATRKALAAEV